MKRIAQSYNHKPKHLLPLISYIAKRNENSLIDYLENKKIDAGVDTKDVIDAATMHIVKEQRRGNFKKAIKDLYNLHPDKKAILELFAKKDSFDGEQISKKEETSKGNFFKTPLFRFIAVIVVFLVLIIVISKLGD